MRASAAALLAALALTGPMALGASTAVAAEDVEATGESPCTPQAPCQRLSASGPGLGRPATDPTTDPASPGTESPGIGTPSESPTDPPGTTDPPESTAPPSPTETPTAPVEAERDDKAPVFAKTPASLGSKALSFTGLSGVSIVDVPTADGGSIRTLKITAESIKISGFSLTVRPPGEPGLVTKADEMTLKGDVSVYLGSITATTKGGKSLTLGTDTPPPLDDVEPGLVRVTMGLVGSMADSITYSNTDQKIVAP